MTGRNLVHVAEHPVAEEDQSEAKHDETRTMTEKRPFARYISLEQWKFGENEESYRDISIDITEEAQYAYH